MTLNLTADYDAIKQSRLLWVGDRYPSEEEFEPNTSYIYIAKASFDDQDDQVEEDEEDNKIANTASRNNAYKIGSTKDIQARSKTRSQHHWERHWGSLVRATIHCKT